MYTVTVGKKPSNAQWFVHDHQDVEELLASLSEAALGLCHVMRVDEGEVRARMARGAAAVVEEFEARGSHEDLRILRMILEPPEMPEDMQMCAPTRDSPAP